jgi:hypothetical protein
LFFEEIFTPNCFERENSLSTNRGKSELIDTTDHTTAIDATNRAASDDEASWKSSIFEGYWDIVSRFCIGSTTDNCMFSIFTRIDIDESEFIRVWMRIPCEDFSYNDLIIKNVGVYSFDFRSIGRIGMCEFFESVSRICWHRAPMFCPVKRDFHSQKYIDISNFEMTIFSNIFDKYYIY